MSDVLGFGNHCIDLPEVEDKKLTNVIVIDNNYNTLDKELLTNDKDKAKEGYYTKQEKISLFGITENKNIQRLTYVLDDTRNIIGVINSGVADGNMSYLYVAKEYRKDWRIYDFNLRTDPNQGIYGTVTFQAKKIKEGEDKARLSTIVILSRNLNKIYHTSDLSNREK